MVFVHYFDDYNQERFEEIDLGNTLICFFAELDEKLHSHVSLLNEAPASIRLA